MLAQGAGGEMGRTGFPRGPAPGRPDAVRGPEFGSDACENVQAAGERCGILQPLSLWGSVTPGLRRCRCPLRFKVLSPPEMLKCRTGHKRRRNTAGGGSEGCRGWESRLFSKPQPMHP